ncbi:MAG: class I lanthipeptide [Hyphomicrobiales bacterium]
MKKLELKKEIIANLDEIDMELVYGGFTITTCNTIGILGPFCPTK